MIRTEIRAFGCVETRAVQDDQPRRIGGYAATFNTVTTIADCFQEVLAPGCFEASIKRGDEVVALFNHDQNYVLGRTGNKTLSLSEDNKGLAFDVTPPDNTWAKDLVVSMERGDLNQCSFAFIAQVQEWDETGDLPKRTILQADLFDVSVVTTPQYDNTSASLRMFEARKRQLTGREMATQLAAHADLRDRALRAA